MGKVIDIATKKRTVSPTHLSQTLPSFFTTKKTKKASRSQHVKKSKKDSSLQTIHLICGVPGSGKTWITKQLTNYNLIPHDEYIGKDYVLALISEAKESKKPVLAEAPFLTRKLIADLRERGATVVAYHIVEPIHIIRDRFERDRKKPFPRRYASLLNNRKHADDWDHEGTSRQILDVLKDAVKSVG